MSVIIRVMADFLPISDNIFSSSRFLTLADTLNIIDSFSSNMKAYIIGDIIPINSNIVNYTHVIVLNDNITIRDSFKKVIDIHFTDILHITEGGFNNYVLGDTLTIVDSFTGINIKTFVDHLVIVDSFTVTYGMKDEVISNNMVLRSNFRYFKVTH